MFGGKKDALKQNAKFSHVMQDATYKGVPAWASLNGPSRPWVRRSQNVATIMAAAFTAR